MSVLERKEKCYAMRTCKAMRRIIMHSEVWDDVKVLLRSAGPETEEDTGGRAEWYKYMASAGAFDHLNTLRVIRNVHMHADSVDEEKVQELEAAPVKQCDLEVLDIVSARTRRDE